MTVSLPPQPSLQLDELSEIHDPRTAARSASHVRAVGHGVVGGVRERLRRHLMHLIARIEVARIAHQVGVVAAQAQRLPAEPAKEGANRLVVLVGQFDHRVVSRIGHAAAAREPCGGRGGLGPPVRSPRAGPVSQRRNEREIRIPRAGAAGDTMARRRNDPVGDDRRRAHVVSASGNREEQLADDPVRIGLIGRRGGRDEARAREPGSRRAEPLRRDRR